MRHLVMVGVAVVVLLLGSAGARGQEAGGWVGQQVITRPGTVLKVGRKVVDDDQREAGSASGQRHLVRVYRVERASGPWLWLAALHEGTRGWARAVQVVSCDQALDQFTSTIRADSNDAGAYVSRGILRHEMGDYDKAIADYSEAIRLDPKYATVHRQRGAVWYQKGAYDKALADCDEAIRLDPKYARAYYGRCAVWCQKGAYDKALADCNEAIRLVPNYAMAHNKRGDVWYEKGECDKAIADYNEAIRLDPRYARAYANRGFVWQKQRESDKAIADYNEAIRLDPRHPHSHNNRGSAWLEKGEYERAMSDLNEASRLDPKYAVTYNNRGIIWLEKGAYDKAIADFNEATRVDPKYAAAYYHRSGAWYRKGEYAKAIADCNEAIHLDPKLAAAYEMRALIWATCSDATCRDGQRTVESATRACELTHWKRAEALEIMAAACAEAGDFDAAVKWQEKYLESAREGQDKMLAAARLSRYRAKEPYHEEPVASETDNVAAGVDVSVQQVEAELEGRPKVDQAVSPSTLQVPRSPAPPNGARRIVAHVGAEVITLDELKEAVQAKVAKLPGGYKPDHEEMKLLTAQILDMLIERRTIVLAAKQELKKPARAKVIMEIADGAWLEEELPPLLKEMGVANETELKAKLAEQGRSLDVIRESYRLEFLARGYLEVKLKAKVTPSDTELRDYYNAHVDDFRSDGGPAPFAEVQDKVRSIVRHQKVEHEANAFLDALRRQTVITTIYDDKVEADPEP